MGDRGTEREEEWRKRRTFDLELKRAVCGGVVETAAATFLLLIAVQFFQTTATVKSIIVVSGPIGLLLSPLGVSMCHVFGWTPARGAAVLGWVSCAGFALAAAWAGIEGFVVGSVLGVLSLSVSIPLQTQIYQDNYPAEERGNLFSKAAIVRGLATLACAWGAGVWLDHSLESYRGLRLVFALFSGLAALWAAQYPSQPIRTATAGNPLHGLRHIRSDHTFRRLLISWMVMGAGNLVMLPLRVEYLGNPKYGIELSPALIALVASMIPSGTQLVFATFWGRLFDRMNFFLLRVILNLLLIAWVFSFFVIGGMPGFVLGGFFFGLAMSGATIAWSLWVTKVAKPELVAEYMGVHTCLTGIRSVVTPFLGFYLISFVSMNVLAWWAIASILAGSLILLPELWATRRGAHERAAG